MREKQKFKTSFSLSMKCKHLLKMLSERFGISQTSMIEMLVREKARAEKVSNAGHTSLQN